MKRIKRPSLAERQRGLASALRVLSLAVVASGMLGCKSEPLHCVDAVDAVPATFADIPIAPTSGDYCMVGYEAMPSEFSIYFYGDSAAFTSEVDRVHAAMLAAGWSESAPGMRTLSPDRPEAVERWYEKEGRQVAFDHTLGSEPRLLGKFLETGVISTKASIQPAQP